jgi:hypothetical protein
MPRKAQFLKCQNKGFLHLGGIGRLIEKISIKILRHIITLGCKLCIPVAAHACLAQNRFVKKDLLLVL